MRKIKTILYLTLLSLSATFFGQSLKVGEEVFKKYESPHPYNSNKGLGSIVWSQEIEYRDATYIAVHFSKLELAEGDFLLVKSPDNEKYWKYYDKGNYDENNPNEGFWSIPIYGQKLLIEIHSTSSSNYYGYAIDKFARGFTEEEINAEEGDQEALCGNDDSVNAKCYQVSEPNVYNRSRAIARLLINGTSACTGWLIGDQGHIMTNNHCVGSSSEANNVSVEFMAEGSNCSSNCQSWFACGGITAASSTTLVQTNSNLDYSLLSLPTNVTGTYGFLQLRQSGASVGERMYIPQHPQAWGKRIALQSDHSNDASDGFSHVQSINEPRCLGTGNDVGYYADTQGGSSGSPVIGYNDHLVIALHHCASCPNRGVPIQEIITNLGSNLPNNALGGCPVNITITTNVTSGSDTRQASSTINASNIISNGATGIYHAGDEVLLSDGFTANNGSIFRGYIEGCSNNFASRQVNNVVYEGYNYEEQNFETKILKDQLKIAPNPSNGVFNLLFENSEDGEIEIVDLYGLTIYKSTFTNQKEVAITIQNSPKGIYILKVKTNTGLDVIEKIVKE